MVHYAMALLFLLAHKEEPTTATQKLHQKLSSYSTEAEASTLRCPCSLTSSTRSSSRSA